MILTLIQQGQAVGVILTRLRNLFALFEMEQNIGDFLKTGHITPRHADYIHIQVCMYVCMYVCLNVRTLPHNL